MRNFKEEKDVEVTAERISETKRKLSLYRFFSLILLFPSFYCVLI